MNICLPSGENKENEFLSILASPFSMAVSVFIKYLHIIELDIISLGYQQTDIKNFNELSLEQKASV